LNFHDFEKMVGKKHSLAFSSVLLKIY